MTTNEDVGKLRWTIDNIYTIARRENRRTELRPEMWAHVLRLCEAVGAQTRAVGVLRDGVRSDTPAAAGAEATAALIPRETS